MSQLIDSFPTELKKLTSLSESLKRKYARGKGKRNKTNKIDEHVNYAFPRIRKLPLLTERNVLSAMNHYDNVKKVTKSDKTIAYKKILKAAESFGICTMGFIGKYKDKYYLEHEENEEV